MTDTDDPFIRSSGALMCSVKSIDTWYLSLKSHRKTVAPMSWKTTKIFYFDPIDSVENQTRYPRVARQKQFLTAPPGQLEFVELNILMCSSSSFYFSRCFGIGLNVCIWNTMVSTKTFVKGVCLINVRAWMWLLGNLSTSDRTRISTYPARDAHPSGAAVLTYRAFEFSPCVSRSCFVIAVIGPVRLLLNGGMLCHMPGLLIVFTRLFNSHQHYILIITISYFRLLYLLLAWMENQ